MRRLRYHIARFLTIIVAIQLLNVSVYPEILQTLRQENPLVLNNEMDSIVEYVSEVLLGRKDSFPEFAHKHHKDLHLHKHGSISLYSEEVRNNNSSLALVANSPDRLFHDKYRYQFYKEINPPPPKTFPS